ncbi:nucleotide sugar dehydrogenase [Listeria kieliensis]|uniref:UDP-N-acetyl-D-mannosamine dehydrogenase n=1 Tax=Listeria kieliensis TaxID=1621700 RepID=A0A3D8TRZ5_9LIST|nr:nucleotide sugar dehydrogenase [Listeria kieliensis]RDX01361.1 UDP-N-acetyl-D-mannosamine dehydrogenase [Listeria kieliensis]
MKIIVLGLGYIGLPTAVMFANHNQEVIGVDINKTVVDDLNQGCTHIEEPGLSEALRLAINKNNFRAQMEVEEADAFIVSVPTPNNNDVFKSCNMDYVQQAVRSIIPVLRQGNTVIIESTISPCSTENMIKPLIENAGFAVGKDVFLAHCPERVLPGNIFYELEYNNRIIGGVSEACSHHGAKIYSLFTKGELVETSASAAELSKLMENTYRDVNIALANELIKTAGVLGIDGLEVVKLANKHPRVNIHTPGPGVGGHCLAVDPYFIIASSPDTTPLMQRAREINKSMPDFVLKETKELMRQIDGKKITVLGITYKGDTDDIRESPALEVLKLLEAENRYQLTIYDPYIPAYNDWKEATLDSDLLLILSDHQEFSLLDETRLEYMKQAVIFDTKNILVDSLKTSNYFNLGNIRTKRYRKEKS